MANSNHFNFQYSCLLYCCKATTNNSSCNGSKKNNSKQMVQISVRNERENTCNGSQSLVCYDFVATQNDMISSSVMQPTPETSSSVMRPSQTPTTCTNNNGECLLHYHWNFIIYLYIQPVMSFLIIILKFDID